MLPARAPQRPESGVRLLHRRRRRARSSWRSKRAATVPTEAARRAARLRSISPTSPTRSCHDGRFHNFMGYDRRWQDERGTRRRFGRALWGLGLRGARAPRARWRRVARELFDAALPHARRSRRILRSRAYAALGLAHVAALRPGDAPGRPALRAAVDADLGRVSRPSAARTGVGAKTVMTYDNARLCEALIRAGDACSATARLSATGLDDARFLWPAWSSRAASSSRSATPAGIRAAERRARFDQQPLEAAALVDAALAALAATGDRTLPRRSPRIGRATGSSARNTARTSLVVTTAAAATASAQRGVNANMGAESTLAYLMSAICARRGGAERSACRR